MRREEKEHLALQKALINDYKDVFGTKSGLRVLADLEHEAGYDMGSICPVGPIDTNRVIYDEARRILILYIHSKTKHKLNDRPSKVISFN